VFAPRKPAEKENGAVTDTGVMRILGDQPVPPPPSREPVATRPCSRCDVPVPESLAVCSHCNCYVGVMPTFLSQMTGDSDVHRN
jgi:hypothetical protein